jgi:predicted nuclease of predicted toxin-antitoxin system
VKFLFDQSADFRLIAHLRHIGHDVSAISQDHPHSLADEDVLAIARDEKRILLVADRDFGELIFHQGLAHTCGAVKRSGEWCIERKSRYQHVARSWNRDGHDRR